MPGCENKCQLHAPSVGILYPELEDRAYDLDWWQLCPDLALQVANSRELIKAIEAEASGPGAQGPVSGVRYSARVVPL